MTVRLPQLESCPFCEYLRDAQPCAFVSRGRDVSVLLNPRQYERGALLVIPHEHAETMLTIGDDAFLAVQATAKRAAALLVSRLGAIGVNVFQNTGTAAGQTVPHYHVHVVPRYPGSDPGRRFREADFDESPAAELASLSALLSEPAAATQ